MRYFATFPAGCYDIIVRSLRARPIVELTIIDHDESSVLFASTLKREQLIELRYLTNVFVVLDDTEPMPPHWLMGRYFRLQYVAGGQPQPLDSTRRQQLQTQIAQRWGLSPRSREGNEFYLITRHNGQEFLTLRLPRAKFKRESLLPGELRPELAHILCLAVGLKAAHRALELCAGSGAIAQEMVRGFGCRQVLAVDETLIASRHQQPPIQWLQADARHLDNLPSSSFDRIVADPPWGYYQTVSPQWYSELATEVARLLKPGGVAVVLAPAETLPLLTETSLSCAASWPILVSGKKATIFKLRR